MNFKGSRFLNSEWPY